MYFSGASMYNFNDEEEEEDAPTKEKVEENEQLKEKMKQIRTKMDKLNISKKVQIMCFHYTCKNCQHK
jgi:hypothetical protein